MVEARTRPAWATVDLSAVRHNVACLVELVAPAAVCASVKADAYGHGAVPVAEAILKAGAQWLAVAHVDEGVELRKAGIEAPILLLSEPPLTAVDEAVARHLTMAVYSPAGIEAVETAAVMHGRESVAVHLKVDTGMHRAGASVDDAPALARRIDGSRHLHLEGLMTHFAVADDPDREADTKAQLERFETVRDALAADGIVPDVLHTANSAGAVAFEAARYDMVRCGIAVYGYASIDVRPAMSLSAEVAFVRDVEAGEGVSYGLRYVCPERTRIAVVPLGYADGVPRRLSAVGGEVLVGGRRCPIAGTITMDMLMVDCGPDAEVAVGDEVVLLGRQGDEVITAEDWAGRLDTISYEIVCGIGPRVPRRYVG
ncbi:MAG TPA: alanine racemase [Acidimicrobiales bacterium]|nr:alanine racemase [Acidimicrobiales bacterium]